jgi:L-fuculose-phosphate aldolase
MTGVASAREQVAAACRRLASERLVHGGAGNVSARAGDVVAVTPAGAALGAVAPEDVAVVDLDGRRLDGRPPTSELQLHLGVYRGHGAGAVAHCHAPFATALSMVLDELPCVHYELANLGGAIRVAPYATFGTPELAALTLDALHERTAALMSNHGTIAYGPDLDRAIARAELLEWACGVYWHAAAIGTPRALDEQQRTAFVSALLERGYGTTQPVVE